MKGGKYKSEKTLSNSVRPSPFIITDSIDKTLVFLSKLEKRFGFKEKLHDVNFFRKGETDEWKKNLPTKLVTKIEKNFEKEMKELDYI